MRRGEADRVGDRLHSLAGAFGATVPGPEVSSVVRLDDFQLQCFLTVRGDLRAGWLGQETGQNCLLIRRFEAASRFVL